MLPNFKHQDNFISAQIIQRLPVFIIEFKYHLICVYMILTINNFTLSLNHNINCTPIMPAKCFILHTHFISNAIREQEYLERFERKINYKELANISMNNASI